MRRLLGAFGLLLGLAGPLVAAEVSVEITGIDGELRKNVVASLSIAEESDRDLASGRIRELHRQAEAEIAVALQPYGYYRPEIDSRLERSEGKWAVRYRVDPGPPIRLDRVDVELEGPGNEDPGFRQRAESFPLASGDRLRHLAYEEGKDRLLDYASRHGYLDAELRTHRIEVDLEEYTARIEIVVATGPRYRFGEVTFRQDVLDPDLLRGYVLFDEGDPFDRDAVLRLHRALADSPYFAGVDVVPHPDRGEEHRVPIEIELVPAKRQRWIVGAGWGSDTGPRGRLQLDVRRVNRRGHRAEVRVEASGVRTTADASYLVPGAYPRTDVLRYSLGYSDLDSTSAESETFIAQVGLTDSRNGWREAYSLAYREEDFTVGLDSGTSRLVVPEASWSRTDADDRVYTRRGWRVRLGLRGAHESLASDSTFLQATVEGTVVRRLVGSLRAIVRTEIGRTETDDFRELPPSMRFFAGGVGSIRGYEFQEVGATDAAGNVIGGSALLTASVELDSLFFERWGRWGLAVFFDVGTASDDFEGPFREGIGGGLRWLSPVGLVRADVGFPLDDVADSSYTVHLSLGPDL